MNLTRRTFLRSSFGLTVLSTIAPGTVLGRIMPESITEGEDGELLGTFSLNIHDFPELQTVRGAVKLQEHVSLLNLNPDHCANFDPLRPPARGVYPIAVSRVAESGPDAVRAVSTLCSHGIGYQVNIVSDPDECVFVCPHLNSAFQLDGTWISPSRSKHAEKDMTPDRLRNLRTFPTLFDSSTGIVVIRDVTLGGCNPPSQTLSSVTLEWKGEYREGSMRTYRLILPQTMHIRLSLAEEDNSTVRILADGEFQHGVHQFAVMVDPARLAHQRIVLETGMGKEELPLQ